MDIRKIPEGSKVTCKINGNEILDGRIHHCDYNTFICQNLRQGNGCEVGFDRYGYKFSWQCCSKGDYIIATWGVKDLKSEMFIMEF